MERSISKRLASMCKYILCVSSNFLCYQLDAQAYRHVFTSPSSVDREPRATRSGNARIHGMTRVTLPSIAYIATQVCPPFRTTHFYSTMNVHSRSDSLSLHRLYFRVQIQSPTQKGFTIPFWISLKTLMRSKKWTNLSYGGTGDTLREQNVSQPIIMEARKYYM